MSQEKLHVHSVQQIIKITLLDIIVSIEMPHRG